MFGDVSPTWGEINWFAYNLPTVDFHNELYGFLQSKAIDEHENNSTEANFDQWLNSKGIEVNKQWIKEIRGVAQAPQNRTLQTFIRNSIHHPENEHNEKYTNEELKLSIQQMIDLL